MLGQNTKASSAAGSPAPGAPEPSPGYSWALPFAVTRCQTAERPEGGNLAHSSHRIPFRSKSDPSRLEVSAEIQRLLFRLLDKLFLTTWDLSFFHISEAKTFLISSIWNLSIFAEVPSIHCSQEGLNLIYQTHLDSNRIHFVRGYDRKAVTAALQVVLCIKALLELSMPRIKQDQTKQIGNWNSGSNCGW